MKKKIIKALKELELASIKVGMSAEFIIGIRNAIHTAESVK